MAHSAKTVLKLKCVCVCVVLLTFNFNCINLVTILKLQRFFQPWWQVYKEFIFD